MSLNLHLARHQYKRVCFLEQIERYVRNIDSDGTPRGWSDVRYMDFHMDKRIVMVCEEPSGRYKERKVSFERYHDLFAISRHRISPSVEVPPYGS